MIEHEVERVAGGAFRACVDKVVSSDERNHLPRVRPAPEYVVSMSMQEGYEPWVGVQAGCVSQNRNVAG